MENENKNLVISYLNLRKAIGLLGILFPIILYFGLAIFTGCFSLKSSISEYYHSSIRDIFVGCLCAVSFFMFTYKGYDSKDNIAANLTSLSALGIALFPMAAKHITSDFCNIPRIVELPIIGILHYVFSLFFFFGLIYFSLVLFVKSDPKVKLTEMKIKRNKLYKTCGYTILICLIALVIYFFLPDNISTTLDQYHYIFWFEVIGLWAFGVSWITKGDMLLADN